MSEVGTLKAVLSLVKGCCFVENNSNTVTPCSQSCKERIKVAIATNNWAMGPVWVDKYLRDRQIPIESFLVKRQPEVAECVRNWEKNEIVLFTAYPRWLTELLAVGRKVRALKRPIHVNWPKVLIKCSHDVIFRDAIKTMIDMHITIPHLYDYIKEMHHELMGIT